MKAKLNKTEWIKKMQNKNVSSKIAKLDIAKWLEKQWEGEILTMHHDKRSCSRYRGSCNRRWWHNEQTLSGRRWQCPTTLWNIMHITPAPALTSAEGASNYSLLGTCLEASCFRPLDGLFSRWWQRPEQIIAGWSLLLVGGRENILHGSISQNCTL